MLEAIFKPVISDDSFFDHSGAKRGAKVFGNPIPKELGVFLDDAYSDVNKRRFVEMYLAGDYTTLTSIQDFELEEGL